MAFASPTLDPSHTTDAQMRALGSSISANIAAMGLVQTTDTGQINWTTVTRGSTLNAPYGYEIWRFNDTLQGSAPVFLKIEYGNNNLTNMIVWISVGTATNGAGTLSGTQQSTTRRALIFPNDTTPRTCYFSGAANRFAMCLWPTVGNAHLFAIERIPDVNGVDTALGTWHVMSTAAGVANHITQVLPQTGGVGPQEYVKALVSHNATSSFGGNVGVGACVMMAGKAWGASRQVLVHNVGDFAVNTQFPVLLYGTSRNYLSISSNLFQITGNAGNNDRLALLWE